jgi:hypothetical protein
VCDPNSLLLSNRHAGINSEATRAHREQWSIEEDAQADAPSGGARRRRKNPSHR